MAGQPFTTGPAHMYAAVGAGGSPLWVGTARNGPTFQQRKYWEPLMNDIAGTRVPLDRQAQGKDIIVTADFTFWEAAVLRQMEAIADPLSADGGGRFDTGGMGTFAILESIAYNFWIQYPYAATKAAMSNLPTGYRFVAATMEGVTDYAPGLKPYSVRAMWYAQPVVTILADGTVSSLLYDFDVTGLPAPG